MYVAVTRNIQISVFPDYAADRSDPEAGQYVWTYTVEIANMGDITVQLMARHWRITDAHGVMQEVRGPGVVGAQPIIPPGESFRYTSACPLPTPSGIMMGSYRMVSEDGRAFDAEIPAFSLDSPHMKRVVN
ncbi:MAG: Co2+/Mg2+ efflux protein ApaG [Methylobacteriaceae bacterium]|nr:Co2+/Mg2+ efflux protein ApaG [Methylobacteriaceae bacterium]